MSEANQDGGRGLSAKAVELFIEAWNARGLKWKAERVSASPAVVKIRRIRVWVKAKDMNAENPDVYLTPSGTIDGDFDFLVIVQFMDAERSRAEFRIMRREETGRLRKSAWLRAKDFLGREAWGKLENAVRG